MADLIKKGQQGYDAQQAEFAAAGLDEKGQAKAGGTTTVTAAVNPARNIAKRPTLQAKFIRVYRKTQTGQQVAVYGVNGTPADLAAFKLSQGENYKTDNETGVPLYFVAALPGRRLHASMKLVQTVQYDAANKPLPGRFVVDDSANLFNDTNKFADMVMAEEAKIFAKQRMLGLGNANPSGALKTQTEQLIEEELILDEEVV